MIPKNRLIAGTSGLLVESSADAFREAEVSAVSRYLPELLPRFPFAAAFLVEPFPVAFAFFDAVFLPEDFFAFPLDCLGGALSSSASVDGPTFLPSFAEG